MKYGHVAGTKQETNGASDWYRDIESQHIARIEAEQATTAYAMAQASEEAGFRASLAQEEAALVQAQLDAEAAALAALTAAAKDALPGQEARIDKGAALVASHAVWPLTSGSYLVGSQRDALSAYLVQRPSAANKEHGGRGWTCECKAFTFMGGACKHVLASMIAVRMGADYTPSYN